MTPHTARVRKDGEPLAPSGASGTGCPIGVRRFGMVSAGAVVGLGVAYASVLSAGLLSLADAGAPIGDPWFTILEILIIAIMPFMVAMMAAIHAWTGAARKPFALLGLVFMGLTAVLTCSVHFTILFLSRSPFIDGTIRSMLSFPWPSLVYGLDIVAWDFFFPLAALSAAPAFADGGLPRLIRYLLILAALLAFAGLIGPASGIMALRSIGIIGYAVVFPFAAAMIAKLLLNTPPSQSGR